MDASYKTPFHARLAYVLISVALMITLLYLGNQILIPVLLALLFAILLRPFVNLLNKKLRFPHVIAVIFSVVIAILVIAAIIFFVSWQIGDIAGDVDKIKNNLNIHYHNIQKWISQQFNISYREQDKYIQQATNDSINNGKDIVGNTLSSFTGVLLNMMLIPIYTFLFLLYQNLFLKFLSKLVHSEDQNRLQEILFEIKCAIQNFLVGLIIEMIIVATLTSVGFMIIGVKYAVLLGVITGLLNLIPYIGILVAGALSIVATLTNSTDISIVVSIIIVNVLVQFIDNNLLVPLIVSSKVKINALITILGVLVGGALAGISGMFLSIPAIAILKAIFDRVDGLKPWGILLGDDITGTKKDFIYLKLESIGHKFKIPAPVKPPKLE